MNKSYLITLQTGSQFLEMVLIYVLGTLRGVLPENYGRFLAKEVNRALDESGRLDATKLSPVIANLAAAFAEFSTYMVNAEKDLS